MRKWSVVVLCCFAWTLFVSGFQGGQEADPMAVAQKAAEQGDYDGAIKILKEYLAASAALPAEKQVAARYLLAKLLFETGKQAECRENLLELFRFDPQYTQPESNLDFRSFVERMRIEAREKAGVQEKSGSGFRPVKRKFPWLLVAVGVVITAAALLLLLPKKAEAAPQGLNTLKVDASRNCVFVTADQVVSSRNVYQDMTYTPSSNAEYAPGAPFGTVGQRHDHSDLFSTSPAIQSDLLGLSIGAAGNFTISQGSNQYYSFLVERGETSDNTGSVELRFETYTLSISATQHCLSIASIPAARIDLEAGTYRLSFSGSAYNSFGKVYKPLVCYLDASGRERILLESEASITVSKGRVYAFFVDFGDSMNNSGVISVDFTKM